MELTITVDITAIEFRRLNSFEWAALNLLNTFQGKVPGIADATAQLCIGEPAFLVSALESLHSAGAVQLKTDEPRKLDLDDYELSTNGKSVLEEDGWECGNEKILTESIVADWPSLRFLSSRKADKDGEQIQGSPSFDEVQERLTPQKVEEWLNQNYNSRSWRVKGFDVINVER